MPELITLDRSGDTKLIWDSENKEEVDAARKTFNDLRRKGYLGYSVKKSGKKKDVITEFDPDSEKLILAPPMAGG